MPRDAPATRRNREPILEVLTRHLEGSERVLEVASGTGQHAIYFAARLPSISWQPSDHDPSALASIADWIDESGSKNVADPIELDAAVTPWPVEEKSFDAIFNANMIHISPWNVSEGLFANAGRILADTGLLFLYGPFRVNGEHTAASNAAFDEDLRRRNPEWGVRDIERVFELAQSAGLQEVEVNDLPANNKLIVFRNE